MSGARAKRPASDLRGDLAGMTEALTRFVAQEFPKAEDRRSRALPC